MRLLKQPIREISGKHLKNKRILYVIGSLNVGGAERHVTQLAKSLKTRGWQPEVFVLSPGGPLSSTLSEAGIIIHGAQPPDWVIRFITNARIRARVSLLFTAGLLMKVLLLRRPAIVHFFLPAAYVIGGIVSLFSTVPVKIMSRRSLNNYQSKHPFFAKVERFLHPKMTLVCGNSQAVIEQLREEGLPSEKLRLIYNGIDISPFYRQYDRNKARKDIGISDEALVFVKVANLIPYKGHLDLIKALALISDTLPKPWVVLLIGRDDGIAADLKKKAELLGISENIRFLGACTDVTNYLRLADVGVLCSHEEGFSNAILEAMAAALPMVVTSVGGNAEAVVDSSTGYVVPPKAPELLADALVKISNHTDRESMGQRARFRAENYFSLESCIDAYEEMYRETKVDNQTLNQTT